MESDYYNIKLNHGDLFKTCKKNLERDGFTSENINYIKDTHIMLNNDNKAKKKMMSLFFLSSGFLLIYLLFMLKKKKK